MTKTMANFRKVCLEIDGDLGKEDLESLKFLCLPFIKRRPVSRVSTAHELFDILESQGLISTGADADCSFLHTLLRTIGRNDLCNKLSVEKGLQVDSSPDCLEHNEYRFYEVLFEISQQMYPRDISDLKYLFHSLPRNRPMKSGIEIFTALVERDLLGPTNLDNLIENLNDIGRKDLTQMLKEFKEYLNQTDYGKAKFLQGQCHISQEVSPRTVVCSSNVSPLSENETTVKQSYFTDDMTEHLNSMKLVDAIQGGGDACQNESVPESSLPCPGAMASASPVEGVPRGHTSENITVHLNPHPSPNTSTPAPAGNSDLPRYKMDANPRGLCLVIDNHEFTYNPRDQNAKRLRNRGGSRRDTENIEKCFKELKFDVVVKENLTDADMRKVFKECADKFSMKSLDCFVTFVLSHGDTEKGDVFVYGRNGLRVYQNEITCMFRPDVCPSLTGKPKLFFLVCCLGGSYSKAVSNSEPMSEVDGRIYTDSAAEDDDEETSRSLVSNDQDFLIGYSTVKGNVSFRDTQQGTWYITALTQVLSQYHERDSLQHMLVEVNNRVARNSHRCKNEKGIVGRYTQVPAPQHTLTKQLWL